MTRDETILELETMLAKYAFDADEALSIGEALTALRGPTREMVEGMRGEWNVGYDELNGLTYVTCSKCEDETVLDGCFVTVEGEPCGLSDFCPACGCPMTDEAVDMILERWKEAVDGETHRWR